MTNLKILVIGQRIFHPNNLKTQNPNLLLYKVNYYFTDIKTTTSNL